MRQFAISDIHGCNRSLNALLDQIGLTTADELFLLGDFIDRGPDSKGVIDTIFHLKSKGYKISCLMGNHDEAILKARGNRTFYLDWLTGWGGEETLDSFKAYKWEDIENRYWSFFQSLPYYMETDAYILVHAGINFQLDDPFSNKTDLLYLRDWYGNVNYEWLGNRCIVHGHTPISKQQCETLLENLDNHQVIDIDTGCFTGKKIPDKGYLTAFDMTNRKLVFQPCLDDVSGYWEGRKRS